MPARSAHPAMMAARRRPAIDVLMTLRGFLHAVGGRQLQYLLALLLVTGCVGDRFSGTIPDPEESRVFSVLPPPLTVPSAPPMVPPSVETPEAPAPVEPVPSGGVENSASPAPSVDPPVASATAPSPGGTTFERMPEPGSADPGPAPDAGQEPIETDAGSAGRAEPIPPALQAVTASPSGVPSPEPGTIPEQGTIPEPQTDAGTPKGTGEEHTAGDCQACERRGGDCQGARCIFSCEAPGSCGQVQCPPGADCSINCGDDACQQIDCRNSNCDIRCLGNNACPGAIHCSGDECVLHCGGVGSCGGEIDATRVGHFDLLCDAANGCPERIRVDANTADLRCYGVNACGGDIEIDATESASLNCLAEATCAGPIRCSGGACDIACHTNESCDQGVDLQADVNSLTCWKNTSCDSLNRCSGDTCVIRCHDNACAEGNCCDDNVNLCNVDRRRDCSDQ